MKYEITLPVDKNYLKKIKLGDIIFLNGIIATARDQAHKRIIKFFDNKKTLPKEFSYLEGGALYHCGPLVKVYDDNYEVISAGPTTSQRMNQYENQVIKKLKISFIIGKGGMKDLRTKEYNVIYLNLTGGCGAIVNKKIEKIIHVEWIDLGLCEAVWFLEVKDFGPLIASQVKGLSLYD